VYRVTAYTEFAWNDTYTQRKFILKEDQAFSLRWNWDKDEKNARHPSVDFLLQSPVGGGSKDFVDMLFR
jgi:hypothetical protein